MAKKDPKNLLAHVPLGKLDKVKGFSKERIASEKKTREFNKDHKKYLTERKTRYKREGIFK